MSKLFDAMVGKTYSLTANGAKTFESSGDKLVDLFSAIGSSRGNDLSKLFSFAYGNTEVSNILATRILLWARDVRGGAGERQTFRSLISLFENGDEVLVKAVIRKIPEVGRWDDMLCFTQPYAVKYAYGIIESALAEGNGLCAKWMPRKGSIAINLRNFLGLSPKDYRKLLVRLTNVVESDMCSKNWSAINYSHVPSKAASNYGRAFMRNDPKRYGEYLNSLESGETKVNAAAMFPYDVIMGMKRGNEKLSNAQWDALPDYLEGNDDNILCMVDTSGSMGQRANGDNSSSLTCMDVALSLGLYVSERSKGIFENQFITFSSTPTLQTVSGNLKQRYSQMGRANWSMSTDLQATFELVLESAVREKISEWEMPTKILIFSDMEFNSCMRNSTNFEEIKSKYERAGYKLPGVVFWNIKARDGNSPVEFDQNGTALVSGFSPSLMKSILTGKDFTPFSMMMDTIMSERYDLL